MGEVRIDGVDEKWQRLTRRQEGVVTARQAFEAGVTEQMLRVRVRRGEWQRVFHGVYVTRNGPLSWHSRTWAGLLYAGDGAALGFDAAAHVSGFLTTPPHLIDIWIPRPRYVQRQPGLRLHRRDADRLEWDGTPPRTHVDQTVLDLTARMGRADDVVGLVTAACERAALPPVRLELALAQWRRHRWRALLTDLVGEVSAGVESPLEWRFQRDVLRRHGLPAPVLQHRQRLGSGWIRADFVFEGLATRVEVDGTLAHRDKLDADVWRDNAVAVASAELTLRYRWRHVAGQPCRTAAQVAAALTRGGWAGGPRPCSPGCPVAEGR